MPQTTFHTTYSNNHYLFLRAKNGSESWFQSIVSYRFGFNGQEMDNEITGQTGTHTTAMFWEYDARLGRRWNLDPKPQISISDYACFANNPVWFSDVNGDEFIDTKSKRFARRMQNRASYRIKLLNEKLNDKYLSEEKRTDYEAQISNLKNVDGEITEMSKSPTKFRFKRDKRKINGEGKTIVDKNGVVTMYYSGSGAIALYSMAHEAKHGYQYLKGKINFMLDDKGAISYGLLYDITDEVEASQRDYSFGNFKSSASWTASKGGFFSSYKDITSEGVARISVGEDSYGWLAKEALDISTTADRYNSIVKDNPKYSTITFQSGEAHGLAVDHMEAYYSVEAMKEVKLKNCLIY